MVEPRKKLVCYVLRTGQSAAVLEQVHDLLENDPRLEFCAVQLRHHTYGKGVTEALLRLREHGVEPIRASDIKKRFGNPETRPDLGIIADNDFRDVVTGKGFPVIYLAHGPGAQIIHDDGTVNDYGLDSFTEKDRAKGLRYAKKFESSGALAERIRREDPELGASIRVTGDLTADRLFASQAARDAYREKFGIGPDQIGVMAYSSWKGGLLDTHPGVLDAMCALDPERYVPLLTTHPRRSLGIGDHPELLRHRLRDQLKQGLQLCEVNQDIVPFLVAADVAIGDHSSVGLYWGAQDPPKPIIYTPHMKAEIDPRSFNYRRHAVSPKLNVDADLAPQIEAARSSFDPDVFPERRDLFSHHGEAASRYVYEIYDSLGIGPPTGIPLTGPAPVPDYDPGRFHVFRPERQRARNPGRWPNPRAEWDNASKPWSAGGRTGGPAGLR